jgi:hypothetical protein
MIVLMKGLDMRLYAVSAKTVIQSEIPSRLTRNGLNKAIFLLRRWSFSLRPLPTDQLVTYRWEMTNLVISVDEYVGVKARPKFS